MDIFKTSVWLHNPSLPQETHATWSSVTWYGDANCHRAAARQPALSCMRLIDLRASSKQHSNHSPLIGCHQMPTATGPLSHQGWCFSCCSASSLASWYFSSVLITVVFTCQPSWQGLLWVCAVPHTTETWSIHNVPTEWNMLYKIWSNWAKVV